MKEIFICRHNLYYFRYIWLIWLGIQNWGDVICKLFHDISPNFPHFSNPNSFSGDDQVRKIQLFSLLPRITTCSSNLSDSCGHASVPVNAWTDRSLLVHYRDAYKWNPISRKLLPSLTIRLMKNLCTDSWGAQQDDSSRRQHQLKFKIHGE